MGRKETRGMGRDKEGSSEAEDRKGGQGPGSSGTWELSSSN